jgi:hypothetical protein
MVKKRYTCSTAFRLALNPQAELPVLREQFFVNSLDAKFFLKTPQKGENRYYLCHDEYVMPIGSRLRKE